MPKNGRGRHNQSPPYTRGVNNVQTRQSRCHHDTTWAERVTRRVLHYVTHRERTATRPATQHVERCHWKIKLRPITKSSKPLKPPVGRKIKQVGLNHTMRMKLKLSAFKDSRMGENARVMNHLYHDTHALELCETWLSGEESTEYITLNEQINKETDHPNRCNYRGFALIINHLIK